jgi:hypothetical protein
LSKAGAGGKGGLGLEKAERGGAGAKRRLGGKEEAGKKRMAEGEKEKAGRRMSRPGSKPPSWGRPLGAGLLGPEPQEGGQGQRQGGLPRTLPKRTAKRAGGGGRGRASAMPP